MPATASGVDGMFAPSATNLQPFAIRAFASSSFSSFWVAHGRATSHLDAPRTLTLGVNAARYALRVLLDAAALNFLDILDNIQVDAVRIVDEAVGIRHGNNLSTQLRSPSGRRRLQRCRSRRWRPSCPQTRCPCMRAFPSCSSTGRSRSPRCARANRRRTGPCRSERRVKLVAQALVLAEHKADLTAADTDIAGRYVGELADVACTARS